MNVVELVAQHYYGIPSQLSESENFRPFLISRIQFEHLIFFLLISTFCY